MFEIIVILTDHGYCSLDKVVRKHVHSKVLEFSVEHIPEGLPDKGMAKVKFEIKDKMLHLISLDVMPTEKTLFVFENARM
jgi:hypothetical protein